MSIISGVNALASGMTTMQKEIQVSANDIANAKTVGFKSHVVVTMTKEFYDVIKAGFLESQDNGSPRPIGAQVGTGTQIAGIYRNLAQGGLQATNQPLDIALTGAGYFAIALPNNRTGYTRMGSFQVDNNRNIVTVQGFQLAETINVPNNIDINNVKISDTGTITAVDPTNNNTIIPIGQLTVYTFANEKGLQEGDNSMLFQTDASGEATEVTDTTNLFKQGYLEESNVSSVEVIVSMVELQHIVELASKAFQISVDTAKSTINIKT